MGINILIRNLPADKIDFDKEVVQLIKVEAGEAIHEDLIRVMSIYNGKDQEAQTTHYRLEGIRNNYFRKAASCNNITFSDYDMVYARLGDIEYDIPEGGVPEVDVLLTHPNDQQIGGIIAPTWYTVHLASGKCCYRHGTETGATGRWVESISTVREDMVFYSWVKFKDDEKFYLMTSSKEVDIKTLAAEAQSCRRNRYALHVFVGEVRPIMSVLWLGRRSEVEEVEDKSSKLAHHAVVYSSDNASSSFIANIRKCHGIEYAVGKITSVVAYDDTDVYLRLVNGKGETITLETTFDKLEGGWNLRSDLHTHKRSFREFYVVYMLEEDVKKAEMEEKLTTAPETVIWSAAKPQKPKCTGTYVTAIAVPVQRQMNNGMTSPHDENVRKHLTLMEQWIPGLQWEQVEEVRGNFDVIVNGCTIVGTAGAKEQLAKQMTGNINTVLVGILPL